MKTREPLQKLVRPLRGGQITIPVEFRKRLGIDDDTMLQMTLEAGELRLRPVRVASDAQGSPWLRELYDYFAPVREEILARGIPEAEVNADIDAAVVGARAARRARAR